MEKFHKSKTEITKLFEALFNAWNQGDGRLYASYFTEDCDYVTFAGQHLRGTVENAASHQRLFNGILKKSKLHGEIFSIRFVSDDIAIVLLTGAVQLRWQKKAPVTRQSINTNVVVKQNGEWKITAFHNCRIQRPGLLMRLLMALKNNRGNSTSALEVKR